MPVLTVIVFCVVGAGLFTALSAALYSALPRSLLETAEHHGRFHGLSESVLVSNGTPTEALPESSLSGQTA